MGGAGANTFLLVSPERFVRTAVPMTAKEQTRRLITLIFAGRNRMLMIRRELPRTSGAGWVRRPFRIEGKEGSPFRGPFTVIGAAVLNNMVDGNCFMRQSRVCAASRLGERWPR